MKNCCLNALIVYNRIFFVAVKRVSIIVLVLVLSSDSGENKLRILTKNQRLMNSPHKLEILIPFQTSVDAKGEKSERYGTPTIERTFTTNSN